MLMEHRLRTKCTSRRRMRAKALREAKLRSSRNWSTRCNSKCSELLQRVILFLRSIIWIRRRTRCRIGGVLKIDNSKKIRSTIFLRRVHAIRTVMTVATAFSTSLRPLILNQKYDKDLLSMEKIRSPPSITYHPSQ